jgi:23S rRNA pseudouridine1911/1915/1917 synthase
LRLDVFWARRLPQFSRARIARSIEAGGARLDGRPRKASFRVAAGALAELEVVPEAAGPQPESVPLSILYEDEALAVVDKPPGMVVHPAKGHWSGTLASALQGHFDRLSTAGGVSRPGIVHRLDRDTSGVIAVAKTDAAHEALARQFQERAVQKTYLAIVCGAPDRDRDRIVQSIGPHPHHRERKAIRDDHPESREAETFYEVLERYPGFALVQAEPKTGRTHQIRLHLMHAGFPVLCDRLYGGRAELTLGDVRAMRRRPQLAAGRGDSELLLNRQALHAHRLRVTHPFSGAPLEFVSPLPADLQGLLEVLRTA